MQVIITGFCQPTGRTVHYVEGFGFTDLVRTPPTVYTSTDEAYRVAEELRSEYTHTVSGLTVLPVVWRVLADELIGGKWLRNVIHGEYTARADALARSMEIKQSRRFHTTNDLANVRVTWADNQDVRASVPVSSEPKKKSKF